MSAESLAPDQSLHLPSLVIKNFRGIDELTIPRLGQVTLLTGKNGVGKTTVLDAVRIWADRGRFRVLEDVLYRRGDTFIVADQEGRESIVPDWFAYFTDRRNSPEIEISIGSISKNDVLRIGWAPSVKLEANQPAMFEPGEFLGNGRPNFIVRLGDSEFYPNDSNSPMPYSSVISYGTLGPSGPSDETVEQYWHDVALGPHEDRAVEALNLLTAEYVERVAAVQVPDENGKTFRRRLMAKVKGRDYPVPLRTLGDGAMRAFAVALSLAKSSNGFLLIDEAENGIHHTIQAKFWKMVLQTAQRNNVQVIATTHSWDALRGFSRALTELEMEDKDGVLYRIQRNLNNLRAVEYDKHELEIITTSGIEAR